MYLYIYIYTHTHIYSGGHGVVVIVIDLVYHPIRMEGLVNTYIVIWLLSLKEMKVPVPSLCKGNK